MDIDFFKKIRILDGGMGQELLARGMKPQGTLWSATAILNEKYHKLLYDTHVDYIKAGAEVIVTTTFASRKTRLRENKVEDKFEYLNKKAGEIAKKTKDTYPDVLIAGGLPPQGSTYKEDNRSNDEISEDFYKHAELLNPYSDFFYLDVISSIKELKLAIKSINEFKKPYLIGAHISQGKTMPSGEKISDIITNNKNEDLLGIMLSCVSPENFQLNLDELKNLGVPFGFKLNSYLKTNPFPNLDDHEKNKKSVDPKEFLGTRNDLTPKKMAEFVKKFKDSGATILGGCCETSPAHIKEMSELV
ncbi:MAG: homocysteine S-methyltransferase [Pelagibacterales bacterium MED-G44]|nr:MAG: homocysteine S-methyltransferase [Pelagibacterales bacterium MED-G44]